MADIVWSFQRFQQSVLLNSPNFVLLGPMRVMYGKEKHTKVEWEALMAALRNKPVPR